MLPAFLSRHGESLSPPHHSLQTQRSLKGIIAADSAEEGLLRLKEVGKGKRKVRGKERRRPLWAGMLSSQSQRQLQVAGWVTPCLRVSHKLRQRNNQTPA